MEIRLSEADDLPVFAMSVDEASASEGVFAASLVEKPAIKLEWTRFAEEAVRLTADETRQTLTGPLLVPGQKIYRNDLVRGEHYLVADEECVRMCAYKFAAGGFQRNSTYEHQIPLTNNVVFESWLTGESNDKAAQMGYQLPGGTWMISMKVNDRKFWEDEVATGNVRGFSLEGVFGKTKIEYTENDKDMNKTTRKQTLLERVKAMFSSEELAQLQDELALTEYITKDGQSISLDETMKVEVVDAEGNVIGVLKFEATETMPAEETVSPAEIPVEAPGQVLNASEQAAPAKTELSDATKTAVDAVRAEMEALKAEIVALKAEGVKPARLDVTEETTRRVPLSIKDAFANVLAK